jgi:hypothetical protein
MAEENECKGYTLDQGVITCYDGVSMMVPYVPQPNEQIAGTVPYMNMFDFVQILQGKVDALKNLTRGFDRDPRKQNAQQLANIANSIPTREMIIFLTTLRTFPSKIPVSLCIQIRQAISDCISLLRWAQIYSPDRDLYRDIETSMTSFYTSFKCMPERIERPAVVNKWEIGNYADYSINPPDMEVEELKFPPAQREDVPAGEEFLDDEGNPLNPGEESDVEF